MPRTDLAAIHRVRPKRDFHLKDVDPADRRGVRDEDEAKAMLAADAEAIGELQRMLYAQDHWAVLLILQGMDASGKDGAVRHVLAGLNPAGCQAFSFKAPSSEELEHDFLWRAARALPERGRIGVFNRSYYEEVVTVRVHPEFLERQRLPPRLVGKEIWDERCEDIVAFERYLARNGVLIRKFFLHVSRQEQARRFLERIEEPEKNWKFRLEDVLERAHWKEYQRCWSAAIERTSTKFAPWFVVPADDKTYARAVIARAVVEALQSVELDFPKLDPERLKGLSEARRLLASERKKRKRAGKKKDRT